MPAPRAYESNDEHLRDELDRIACLARAQLLRLEHTRSEASRERFWHLSNDDLEALANDDSHSPLALFDPSASVRQLLDRAQAGRSAIDARLRAGRMQEANRRLMLPRLIREFAFSSTEVDALLLALLPALHSTSRYWYGILQLDANRTQATVGLLIEMLARSGSDFADLLARLGPSGKLATSRTLVLAGTEDDPIASRSVSVDDRVSRYLFGGDALDPRLVGIARVTSESPPAETLPLPPSTTNRLAALPNLRIAEPSLWAKLRLGFTGPDAILAVQACSLVAAGSGRRLLTIDVQAALASTLAWATIVELALREARLGFALPMFIGAASLLEPEHRQRWSQLIGRLETFESPVAIESGDRGGEAWRGVGEWLSFHLDAPTVEMREKLWTRLLDSASKPIVESISVTRAIANSFRLTGSQIDGAWHAARGTARLRNVYDAPVNADDLFKGCREQSAHRLIAYAQRIEPRSGLSLERDIVLPAASLRVLTELRSRIRNYRRVQSAMGLGEHMRLARGVTAMFVGGSGTGKTMAAEVLASEERIDLYRIDLGALVSKWVGETEKNLSRVFADAERANCMLFFDEADAMFGRRGEVTGGQDRWANLQVNHLLQSIEEYSGVVILATNLRQNLDEAFQRRIHIVVDFLAPDAAARHALWNRLLPAASRRAVAADEVEEIAQRFELTGGNIRNVVLDACYRALERDDATVTTRDLAASIAREFQKSGRPVMQGEFGRYYDWAMQDVIAPPRFASSP